MGPDGATHQMLEDIALMRVLPNMVVLAPCDSVEAEKATLAMAADKRPNYMRLAREKTPVLTTKVTPFEIGPADVFPEFGTHSHQVSNDVLDALVWHYRSRLEQPGVGLHRFLSNLWIFLPHPFGKRLFGKRMVCFD